MTNHPATAQTKQASTWRAGTVHHGSRFQGLYFVAYTGKTLACKMAVDEDRRELPLISAPTNGMYASLLPLTFATALRQRPTKPLLKCLHVDSPVGGAAGLKGTC